MRSKFNGYFDLEYHTELSALECTTSILAAPHTFKSTVYNKSALYAGEDAKVRNYDCYPVSELELHLTFRGGQYTKQPIRSRFVLEFLEEDAITKVLLKFQGDFWGLPLMTPTAEIDSFMYEKIQGVRKNS
ncbi:MAG: hypothetical protein E7454_08025 [Ruminococcaceae bacterium]|nr:hypothetical protein [Oscillospiraceae bacterium]